LFPSRIGILRGQRFSSETLPIPCLDLGLIREMGDRFSIGGHRNAGSVSISALASSDQTMT
jgi:hypothetical protein